ncbi:ADAMTS-like protein 1 [Trichonephila clavipes]|nr:ADAMTS-like protein 1 [Trichonephila clavipes]
MPQTLDHLEDNIRRVIADIRPQMLEKVIENWTSRLDYIRASRGRIQLSESSCRNKETNEEVDPRLCNLSIRPRTKAKHCNRHPCPVVWATGKWGPCSVTCGVGVQSRPVFCVQGGPNGSRIDVKSEFCPRHKPLTERSCSVEECPRWFQGPWSPVRILKQFDYCSVTCGEGLQTRAVVCRDTKNQYSELCDTNEMPRPQKICEMPDPCPLPPKVEDMTTPPPCIFTPSTEEEPSTPTTEEPTTATEPVIYLTQAPPNRLRMVMVDTRGLVTRLMVDNEESGAVTADLTINLSFQSDEVLGRPLPS